MYVVHRSIFCIRYMPTLRLPLRGSFVITAGSVMNGAGSPGQHRWIGSRSRFTSSPVRTTSCTGARETVCGRESAIDFSLRSPRTFSTSPCGGCISSTSVTRPPTSSRLSTPSARHMRRSVPNWLISSGCREPFGRSKSSAGPPALTVRSTISVISRSGSTSALTRTSSPSRSSSEIHSRRSRGSAIGDTLCMSVRAAERATRALDEGRARLERGDVAGGLDRLEHARKDFLKAEDLAGLRALRTVVEDSYRESAEADEPAFERLLYASAQNIRFLSRRAARKAQVPWEDPHPELDAPGRPEMRAERGLTQRDRRWVVVAGVLSAVVVAAVVVGAVFAYKSQRVVLVNDTNERVEVALCDDRACERESPVTTTLDPGERFRAIGHNFRITREDGTTLGCIHSGGGTTRAVSDARECGASGSVGAMPASAPSRRVR